MSNKVNYKEFVNRIMDVVPGAEIIPDLDGQIVIYTDFKESDERDERGFPLYAEPYEDEEDGDVNEYHHYPECRD